MRSHRPRTTTEGLKEDLVSAMQGATIGNGDADRDSRRWGAGCKDFKDFQGRAEWLAVFHGHLRPPGATPAVLSRWRPLPLISRPSGPQVSWGTAAQLPQTAAVASRGPATSPFVRSTRSRDMLGAYRWRAGGWARHHQENCSTCCDTMDAG